MATLPPVLRMFFRRPCMKDQEARRIREEPGKAQVILQSEKGCGWRTLFLAKDIYWFSKIQLLSPWSSLSYQENQTRDCKAERFGYRA